MKALLKALRKQKLRCDKIIEHREEVYDNRSYDWQYSENGGLYESDTMSLDDIRTSLEDSIKDLEEILGEYPEE